MRWVTRVVLACALLFPQVASAQAISDADKAKAKESFTRGVERLRADEFRAAADHFEEAYAVAPYAVILYNLGVAYAKLDRPVKAATALEQVIAEPGKLKPERVSKAKQLLAEQQARIGQVALTIDQPGASIRIDGAEAGKSPDTKTVRVSAGVHFVEVVKSGFAPFRKEVTITAKSVTDVTATLEATELAFAQVWIRTPLRHVEIWLDGTRIGKTPLEQSIPVLPGKHSFELRRLGYQSVTKELDVGAGSTAEITATPSVDADSVRKIGGTLRLDTDAPENIVLTVDGVRLGVYAGAIALPPGTHDVQVERAGFFPTTLRVFIAKGRDLQREVVMDPTPETIADHNADATLFTALGWGFVGLTAAALGGGIGYWVYNEGSADDEQATFDAALAPGGQCEGGLPTADCQRLAQDVNDANARIGSRRALPIALWIGSAAFLATGITLLVLAPDGDKYTKSDEGLDELGLTPILAPTFGGAYGGVTGRF